MVLTRALFKEAALTSLAIATILFVLIFFVGFTQAIGKVAVGKSTGDIFLQLLALRMLGMSDVILPLSLFLGILFSVGRWYQDSEMTVLSACGVSIFQLLRPILLLALIFAVLETVSSLYFSPWADRVSTEIRQESKEKLSLSGIRPGVFNDRGAGQGVFYAERIDSETGQLENVFVSNNRLGKPSPVKQGIVIAKRGQQVVDDKTGIEYLLLEDGKSYDGRPGQSDYQIIKFGSYRLRLSSSKMLGTVFRVKALPTSELWRAKKRNRYYKSELHWRLAQPVATIILAMVAVAMAYIAPRRSRFSNLFVAILIFFLYINVLSVGASLLKKGVIPVEAGLWWIHFAFLCMAIYMLWRRANDKALLTMPWGRKH